MYLTCVRHRVKEYEMWRKAFDHNANMLFATFGCLGTQIVQVNGDPTDIAIINTWPSKKNWDDFSAAHALPEYQGKLMTPEDGGVIGEPTFFGGEVI
jgi:quinol monooxygenase YgiN